MSAASNGRPQVYKGLCLVSMTILTVDTQGDSCESTSHHAACHCCGIHAFILGDNM